MVANITQKIKSLFDLKFNFFLLLFFVKFWASERTADPQSLCCDLLVGAEKKNSDLTQVWEREHSKQICAPKKSKFFIKRVVRRNPIKTKSRFVLLDIAEGRYRWRNRFFLGGAFVFDFFGISFFSAVWTGQRVSPDILRIANLRWISA